MWEALPVSVVHSDPQLASLGRRVLAAGIDATCILSAIAAALAATVSWGWRKDDEAGRLAPLKRWNEWAKSPAWRCAALAYAVGLRNWRTPGMRLTRLRRVDARTGGPVTVRRALTRHLAEQARGAVNKRWLTSWQSRTRAPVDALKDDVKAAHRAHRGDPEAQQQAVMDIYAAAGVNPSARCWQLMVPVAAEALVTLCGPRHRSPYDWIAGIVVVRD
jgi:hypothetical protein